MSLEEKMEAALWDDLPRADSFPAVRPLLAHYTSMAAFEGIVKSNEIWLSHPLYTNDWEELRFGMTDCAQELLFHDGIRDACRTEEAHNKLVGLYDYYFKEFESKHAFDTYALCLCSHDEEDKDGRLSMWRGYGDNGSGVALVFDTTVIPLAEEPLLIVDRVVYLTREQRLGWVKHKLDMIAAAMSETALSEDDLSNVAYHWIERLKLFSLFTKHTGFHEESEWRIVYMPDRDKNGLLTSMLSYEVSQKGVVPKLKLRIAPIPNVPSAELTLERLIHRIILGPIASTAMAAKAVARMLVHAERPLLAERIAPSSIPFRV